MDGLQYIKHVTSVKVVVTERVINSKPIGANFIISAQRDGSEMVAGETCSLGKWASGLAANDPPNPGSRLANDNFCC